MEADISVEIGIIGTLVDNGPSEDEGRRVDDGPEDTTWFTERVHSCPWEWSTEIDLDWELTEIIRPRLNPDGCHTGKTRKRQCKRRAEVAAEEADNVALMSPHLQ
ncbi:Os06g0501800 [Oryza sativa Japonica Group]|uniref:Os06g0501800 protein n=1 Tax=Oryza sativa subsp. japonica TaxID=39947 RepID=A0A0N7KM62_ORYSJ|nr:Os06g0501800 [Oryza sativa Japonica Group]